MIAFVVFLIVRRTEAMKRSGYSRRNLQLVFQHRFGCGPIQWVRRGNVWSRPDAICSIPGPATASAASPAAMA
jgi:AraC-like DNA-binding protein